MKEKFSQCLRLPSSQLILSLLMIFSCIFLYKLYVISWPLERTETIPKGIIGKIKDNLYYVDLNKIYPKKTFERNSWVILREDNKDLTPDNSFTTEIMKEGKGRNLNVGKHLYFSTTDQSNPKTNKKKYTITFNKQFSLFAETLIWLSLFGIFSLWMYSLFKISVFSAMGTYIVIMIVGIYLRFSTNMDVVFDSDVDSYLSLAFTFFKNEEFIFSSRRPIYQIFLFWILYTLKSISYVPYIQHLIGIGSLLSLSIFLKVLVRQKEKVGILIFLIGMTCLSWGHVKIWYEKFIRPESLTMSLSILLFTILFLWCEKKHKNVSLFLVLLINTMIFFIEAKWLLSFVIISSLVFLDSYFLDKRKKITIFAFVPIFFILLSYSKVSKQSTYFTNKTILVSHADNFLKNVLKRKDSFPLGFSQKFQDYFRANQKKYKPDSLRNFDGENLSYNANRMMYGDDFIDPLLDEYFPGNKESQSALMKRLTLESIYYSPIHYMKKVFFETKTFLAYGMIRKQFQYSPSQRKIHYSSEDHSLVPEFKKSFDESSNVAVFPLFSQSLNKVITIVNYFWVEMILFVSALGLFTFGRLLIMKRPLSFGPLQRFQLYVFGAWIGMVFTVSLSSFYIPRYADQISSLSILLTMLSAINLTSILRSLAAKLNIKDYWSFSSLRKVSK